MRDKEGKQDYRFMPEPNLPPLIVYDKESVKGAPSVDTAVNIDELRTRLPELPEAQRQRLMDDYGIKMESAIKLVVSEMMVGHWRYEVTPILEVLRPPQNLQNRRVCVLYAKTPKSEVLRPPQKLQNRRFCVVLKILLVILNTPKSEVLRTIRKNSKTGGFAPTAKTPKSEVLRSFKNIINNI